MVLAAPRGQRWQYLAVLLSISSVLLQGFLLPAECLLAPRLRWDRLLRKNLTQSRRLLIPDPLFRGSWKYLLYQSTYSIMLINNILWKCLIYFFRGYLHSYYPPFLSLAPFFSLTHTHASHTHTHFFFLFGSEFTFLFCFVCFKLRQELVATVILGCQLDKYGKREPCWWIASIKLASGIFLVVNWWKGPSLLWAWRPWAEGPWFSKEAGWTEE